MKIKSIKKIKRGRVINLTVHKNHTFITKNGIVTHNCDYLSQNAQAAFRGFLDEFSSNCAFVFTCNYRDKIIKPLQNRLIKFDFDEIFMTNRKELGVQIFKRLQHILDSEKVEYQKEDVKHILLNLYPSIRDMIIYMQNNITNNILTINENLKKGVQYHNIMQNIKDKNFTLMRQNVADLPNPDGIYSWLWKNLDTYIKPQSQPIVIPIIARYQFQASAAIDKELNTASMCVELMANPKIEYI